MTTCLGKTKRINFKSLDIELKRTKDEIEKGREPRANKIN